MASFISHIRKDLKLGGLTGIYLLINGKIDMIGEEILRVIVEEVFNSL